MTSNPLNILILSSMRPSHSANLGQDAVDALKNAGHNVDFLSSGDNSVPVRWYRPFLFLRKLYLKLFLRFNKIARSPYESRGEFIFPCMLEDRPSVPSFIILKAIKKKYDLIITLFWQDMMTAASLYDIYQKTGTPIIIQPIDMFPLTGGCYYSGECMKFLSGCKDCHSFKTPEGKAQIESNWLLKKKIYSDIKCTFTSNSYMLAKLSESEMLKGVPLNFRSIVINEDVFKQREVVSARQRLGIPDNKTFIIMSRTVPFTPAYERKGMKYLISSINNFAKDLTAEDKDRMLLLAVGKGGKKLASKLDIDTLDLGIVQQDKLIDAYSVSTLFMSTTVDDAGPSMVNQSIMCGTPVLCFHIGTAIDVIKHKKNGYMVNLHDADGLTEGLKFINGLSNEEYAQLRADTRDIAMQYNSKEAYSKAIESAYRQLINQE